MTTSIAAQNIACDLVDRLNLNGQPHSGQQIPLKSTTATSLVNDDASKESSMTNFTNLNQITKYFRQNDNNDTQLHIAIGRKQSRLSIWLIDNAGQPSNLDIVNKHSLTALHVAAMTCQAHLVRKLVLAGANTEIVTALGYTALHIACDKSDIASVKALTEPLSDEEKDWLTSNGKELPTLTLSLETRDKDGYTALHVAAVHDNVEVIKQLIDAGANLDSIEKRFGRTPFHIAVENNCKNVFEYLIEKDNSYLNKLTAQGMSPYEIALNVDKQLAEDLLSLGAEPIVRDPEIYKSSEESSETNSNDDNFSDESGDELRRRYNYVAFLNKALLEP